MAALALLALGYRRVACRGDARRDAAPGGGRRPPGRASVGGGGLAAALVLVASLAPLGTLLAFTVDALISGAGGLGAALRDAVGKGRDWLVHGPLSLSELSEPQIDAALDDLVNLVAGQSERIRGDRRRARRDRRADGRPVDVIGSPVARCPRCSCWRSPSPCRSSKVTSCNRSCSAGWSGCTR